MAPPLVPPTSAKPLTPEQIGNIVTARRRGTRVVVEIDLSADPGPLKRTSGSVTLADGSRLLFDLHRKAEDFGLVLHSKPASRRKAP